MYGNRKPSNWYELDYDTQRDWEKRERERQDLEYDLRRSQQEAEEAREEAEAAREKLRRARRQAADWAEQEELEAMTFRLALPSDLEAALRRAAGGADFEPWLLGRLSAIAYADQDTAALSMDGPWPYPENDNE